MAKELFFGILTGPVTLLVFILSFTISMVIDSSGTLALLIVYVAVRLIREYMKIPQLDSRGIFFIQIAQIFCGNGGI